MNVTEVENTSVRLLVKYVPKQYFMFKQNLLFGYLIIVVNFLGCAGNFVAVITIIVRKLYRRTSMFIYFVFIHLLDLILCLVWGLLFHALPNLLEVSCVYQMTLASPSFSVAFCRVSNVLVGSVSVASALIMVTANATKLMALLFPFGVMARDTHKIALVACLSSVAVGFVLHISIYSFLVTGDAKRLVADDNIMYIEYSCVPDFTATIIFTISRLLEVISYSTLPGILLIALSISILVVYRKKYRQHKALIGQGTKGDSSHFVEARNSIIMHLPLSIIHIACTFPAQIQQLYEAFAGVKLMNYYIVRHFPDINHAINPFIQFAVSKTYRNAVLGRKFV